MNEIHGETMEDALIVSPFRYLLCRKYFSTMFKYVYRGKKEKKASDRYRYLHVVERYYRYGGRRGINRGKKKH